MDSLPCAHWKGDRVVTYGGGSALAVKVEVSLWGSECTELSGAINIACVLNLGRVQLKGARVRRQRQHFDLLAFCLQCT